MDTGNSSIPVQGPHAPTLQQLRLQHLQPPARASQAPGTHKEAVVFMTQSLTI